jgi:hypothetical protein
LGASETVEWHYSDQDQATGEDQDGDQEENEHFNGEQDHKLALSLL